MKRKAAAKVERKRNALTKRANNRGNKRPELPNHLHCEYTFRLWRSWTKRRDNFFLFLNFWDSLITCLSAIITAYLRLTCISSCYYCHLWVMRSHLLLPNFHDNRRVQRRKTSAYAPHTSSFTGVCRPENSLLLPAQYETCAGYAYSRTHVELPRVRA